MKLDRAQRTVTVTLPDATGGIWGFTFSLDFEQVSTQRVVVRWTEPSIGSGEFKLAHFGVSWGCLFQAFQRVQDIAAKHAFDWNEMDVPRK